jgi:uncharacterized repeat protein (TIGR01451 family)/uncharacterized repeat protein (TIGR02543 family)
MKSKLLTKCIIILFIISNINIIFVTFGSADENQPQWPTNWISYDIDPTENGDSDDYRDVYNAYYHANDYYLYFRLECYGYPNFSLEPECRYKWFIDIDDPHNMGQSGGNVFDAEYMLIVEDSPKPGGDGIGDIYLLEDLNNDGFIGDDYPDYLNSPGPILNSSIAGYRIEGNYIDAYISQEYISNPEYSYFTWATDQEDPNIDSAPNIDRSNSYWDADLSKADLSIIKYDSIDPIITETSFIYTLNVTNHGPHIAENINVSDNLPSGVSFYNSNPAPNGSIGSTYWWTYSSLDIGESIEITINITIDTGFTGNITNFANVYSDTHDPLLGNNEASEQTLICELFYLYTNIDGSGSINQNPQQPYYIYGDNINLQANADPGWTFSHWTGSITGSNNPTNIIMNEDKTITAHFTQDQYTLNTNTIGNGSINQNPQQPYYIYGDNINLQANADPGWTFSHWTGSITGSNNPTNIIMNEDKTITAHFTQDQYTLNITIIGNGNVSKDPDQENYTFGTIVELTANPLSGWKFDYWSGDISGSNNPSSINMTSNMNITAHFKKSKKSGGGGGGYFGPPTPPIQDTNIPPIANAGGPYYGFIGENILFNASLSYDPDHYIKEWLWEFGDGSFDSGEIIYHNYSLKGEYIVNLTVIDTEYATDFNITIAVIIEPNSPPSLPEIEGPIEGIINVDYNFSFVSNDDNNDEIKYIIDWGDGNISESDFIPAGQYFKLSHRWTESGNYTIKVTADDNETITIEDFEITIRDPEKPDIPEEYNIFWLILLLIVILLLLLLYFLARRYRKEDEENNEKET